MLQHPYNRQLPAHPVSVPPAERSLWSMWSMALMKTIIFLRRQCKNIINNLLLAYSGSRTTSSRPDAGKEDRLGQPNKIAIYVDILDLNWMDGHKNNDSDTPSIV